jgi:serine/threonine protein phosphatase PrpC
MNKLWQSYSVTDVGKKRSVNQDAIFVSDTKKLWVIADGMGGHAEGDKASQALVDSFARLDLSDNLAERIAQIEASICKVNSDLQAYSKNTLHGKAIGTTVVVYTVCQDVGALLWAGDSRAYHVVKSQIEQLSWDHSHVEQLVRAGQITKEEAAGSKLSNLINRAVGAHTEIFFDHVLVPVQPDSIILLCSDGLTNEVDDAEINDIIQSVNFSQKTIDTLLQKTLNRGARDNVSIIVIGNQISSTASHKTSEFLNGINADISKLGV